MERHPGIEFRSGPGGRRAALIDGPDVWEVVRAVPQTGVDDDGVLTSASARTGLTADQVRAALRYYAEHGDEIGGWLRCVDEEAARAEAEWRRERASHR